MMQCGARVDDERQVRSGVGNERDKAVYSAVVVREKETNLQGRLSFNRPRRLCASLTHARRRGLRGGYLTTSAKNTTGPDRARPKWVAAGWGLFMMARLD
jgi:hypothetical protein